VLPLSFQTWDDRGSWFKAPTMRGLTDMAVTIGATALLPGAGSLLANAALNLADDAVFAMLDVGGGYKSWEAAGLEFGKKAACSAVNIGVGQLFNPAVTALNSTPGVSGVIGRTMVGGMQSFTTSTASSAINAITWDAEHGLGWSNDAFTAGVQGGLVSAATGMTSTFTSGMLNNWNAGDKLYGFSKLNQQDVYTLNSTIGNLASQGVNFALTGDFTLNVLNFGMFGVKDTAGNLVKNGLLELHLGKKGATMNVGMGGTDVSLGTIASAMGGLEVVQVNREISKYVKTKQLDVAVALRSQYGFGDRVQQGQLWDLLHDKAGLEIGGVDHADADAQTKREGDKRVIHLNGYRAGMSREEQLQLGITLAHEAYRNGIDDGVLGQGIETRQAIDGHIQFAQGMAGTYGIGAIGMKMAQEVVAYWKAQRGDRTALDAVYDRYDASADYWLIKLDGTIVDTEEKAFFREYIDQNGEFKYEKVEGSEYTDSLTALYAFLGENMIQKMYKKSAGRSNSVTTVSNDVFIFDNIVLQDVLGWTSVDRRRARNEGFTMQDFSEEQKQKIMIEQLLMQNGYKLKGDKWEGSNLKVPGLKTNESIGIRLVNGQWEKFTAGMEIRRDTDAFEVWKNNTESNSYEIKDSADVYFYKRNLDTGISEFYYGATKHWASIDKKSKGTEVSIGGNTYKGNTIVSEWFKMHLTDYWDSDTYGVPVVGVFTDARILSDKDGTQILTKAGKRYGYPNDGRWLMHSFDKGASSAGCIGPMSDIDAPPNSWNIATYSEIGKRSGAYYMQQILNKLMGEWGIYKGYEFSVHLVGQQTPTYYKRY